MKKFLTISIFFLFLVFPLISSIEFDMETEFNQGETLLAVISGNFLDQITENNVFFYKDHVRIPVVYGVGKIDGDFYLYGMLTEKTQGNYSIKIEGVRYMNGAQIIDEDIIKNFTITEDTSDFSINPGFVITSEDFFLEVQNLKNQKITIQIGAPEVFISESSLEIKSGETKKINFEVGTENQVLEEIKLSSGNTNYSIPIFVDLLNETEEKKKFKFKFEPNVVNVSMATDSDTKRIIYILNNGDTAAENIIISISSLLEPYLEISPETINKLDQDANKKVEINIISDSEPGILEGIITADTGNFSTSVSLVLNFIEDYIPKDGGEENESGTILTTCAQLEGEICENQEECIGETKPTKEGICCLASCKEIVKSPTGKIIGWVVIVTVILFLFWAFKKYKKVKPKVNLLKIGKKK